MSNPQPVSEKRTQIYLPEWLHKAVKEAAKKHDMSMAAVIREAVEEKVKPNEKVDRNKGWEELRKLAGGIKGEPRDMSENIGKYIKQMNQENQIHK